MEENQAVARLVQGDIDGLEILARKYYLQAVRAAYLIVRDHNLAEDVAQQSFVNLPGKINQFDESKPFRPWFMRSVVNNAISACRKRNRVASLDGLVEDDRLERLLNLSQEGRTVEDTFISAEMRSAIWNALEQLNPQQRAAIVMRYYLDMSESELAEELQRPKSTIKWLLFAARRKLRQLLKPLHDDDSKPESILAHEE